MTQIDRLLKDRKQAQDRDQAIEILAKATEMLDDIWNYVPSDRNSK